MKGEDQDLGMGCAISRRDFVQGVAAASVALATAPGSVAAAAAGTQADVVVDPSYPPSKIGMRGMHPGAFEAAHALVEGAPVPTPVALNERYDLVVVGAGLSGLAAAWFYRQRAGSSARILILDNHDDFGGHAKRNEFIYQERRLITTGGSGYMVSPPTWRRESLRLLEALGVNWQTALMKKASSGHPEAAASLKPATLFRREVFGVDKVVLGSIDAPTPEFLAQTPLPSRLQADLLRLMTGKIDYLAGLSVEEKIAKLRSMSYRDYLLNVAKLDPGVLDYTGGVWALDNDMASAWFAFYRHKPGFDGLGVPRPPGSPESAEAKATATVLPAGNSDLARLIVRALIPESLAAGPWQDITSKSVNYAVLDRPGQPTRIRLSSMVVRVQHVGPRPVQFEPEGREVEVLYLNGDRAYSVRAKDVILAGMNNMIPFICPEIPAKQKAALRSAVRAANQTTNVLFRNWEPFAELGVSRFECPLSFFGSFGLQFPQQVSTDAYAPKTPADPVIVHFGTGKNSGIASNPTMVEELVGAKIPPGLPMDARFRTIRAGLLQTPFSTFERAVRLQATRALAGTRFDPARDILAITVNRWPHGFATGRNQMFDEVDEGEVISPVQLARRRFGRIAIANTDASGIGLVQTAFEEAARAVDDLEERTYGFFETF